MSHHDHDGGGHGHDHGHHHGHGHNHDHDHDEHGLPSEHTYETTPDNLVYDIIDFSKVTTLNESEFGSGAGILQKTWTQRLENEPVLESDADEQLLMTIPFTGQVRLQSILMRASDSLSAPSKLKVFINREDMDFQSAEEISPTQSFDLVRSNEIQEYAVKRALFNNTGSLVLFFSENFAQGSGDEHVTRIEWLALKGETMKLSKEPVSFLYEAAANPKDHAPIVGTKMGMEGGLGGRGDGL